MAPGTSPAESLEADVAPEPERAPRPAPRPKRTAANGFWRYGFPAVMVVLVLLVPVLLLIGSDAVLHSTEGALDDQVTDPAAPGWQAITEPTPTLLLLETGDDGSLLGATVLSLASDESGAVLFIPVDTAPTASELPISITGKQAPDTIEPSVATMIGAGIGETTEVPSSAWADLVAPVEPLTVDNPDDVYIIGANGQRTLQFPHGSIQLGAKDVAAFLQARNTNESDVNRLQRHQKFWQAWLQKVGTSDRDDVVPGEKDSGLGRFIRALAVDRVEMASLPVNRYPVPLTDATVYLPAADQARTLVARLIPFPIGSPPGARARIKLLDGTGRLDHGLAAAAVLVQANGQIDLIGNAPSFDVATTKLVYSNEDRKAEVERLRDALGVGTVEKGPDVAGTADVTITLGQDYLTGGRRAVAEGTTVTTGG